jgi:hypothetical protein
MSRHHVVQYQMFDVDFANPAKSYELQNKISNIFHNELTQSMDELFTRLIPENIVITLDELTIDLGSIAYDGLENNLANLVLIELEKELLYRLRLQTANTENEGPAGQFKTYEASCVGLLEYFLMTGTLPWWATGDFMTDPLKVMEHILVKDAAGLKHIITKAGQNAYVRQRLVNQFPEKMIRDIIVILEPAQAAFIFDYHVLIVKTHKDEKLIASVASIDLNKELWVFILTYLLVDRGSFFNQKTFVKSTMGQMARHYNRGYIELLTLLEKALASHRIQDSNKLALIINDLAIEEYDNESITKPGITNEGIDGGERQDIELLKHYLVFGTLPWWAEPYSNEHIMAMFFGLMETNPETMGKLIFDIGQKEGIRKRIATEFEDDVITAIIKLLEPANAGFILKYVEQVQVVHKKKPIANADSRGIKKSVWKFVFDFLLSEKGTVFNQRAFLESNIRSLANNYNVQYADMLLFLAQSVAQMHQDSMEHKPLFHLLAELLSDFNELSAKSTGRVQVNKQQLSFDTELHKTVVLKDVLLHWLTYGNIPWWGSAYFDLEPPDLLESLLLISPGDALILINYAGTEANIRRRVIYQFPRQLILDVFSHYPGSDKAIMLYQQVMKAFAKADDTNATDEPAKFLLAIFWDVYIINQYKTFDSSYFIRRGIHDLAKHFGVKESAVLSALKSILSKTDAEFYTGTLHQQIDTNVENGKALKEPDSYNQADTDITALISKHSAHKKPLEKEDILSEALHILEYFLTSGKLPETFKGVHVQQLLKQLLLLLNYERPTALYNLLQHGDHMAAARLQLHNVFAITVNIAENGVSRALKPYLENDILLYVKQMPGIDDGDHDGFTAIVDRYLAHPESHYNLITSLLKNPAIAKYISRHYPDKLVYHLLSKTDRIVDGAENIAWLGNLQLLVANHMGDTLQRTRFNILLREFSLLFLGGHFSTSNSVAYIKQLLSFISSQNHSLFMSLSDVLFNAGVGVDMPGSFTAKLPIVLTELDIHQVNHQTRQAIRRSLRLADEEALQKVAGLNDTRHKDFEKGPLKDELKRKQQQTEEVLKKKNKPVPANSEVVIYINNAGLVLLNPFLPTYFIRLGMLENGKFIGDEAQMRAVHLLQYLVNGMNQSAEHILVLNKILCNMPVDEPVPQGIILTEKEKNISEEVLKAVLNAWDKLKNTSIQGFQNSFLQRTGALVYKNDAWNLRVEQRGYDVLLQALPWSIGMIKTSWMDSFLYVEWI